MEIPIETPSLMKCMVHGAIARPRAWQRSATVALLAVVTVVGLGACGEVTSAEGECDMRTWQPVELANASFDQYGGWTAEPTTNPALCEPDVFGIAADSGTVAACFGAYNGADQTLTQPVDLPPGTTQVRLRGRRCLVTTEPGDAVTDTLVMALQDGATLNTVAALGDWSNLDAGEFCSWQDFELMAPVEDSPASVILYMRVVLDDLEVTTFFLDTLELDAYGC